MIHNPLYKPFKEMQQRKVDEGGDIMTNENTITATYDRDSKRYHRYIIDEEQGIVGNIYIPKGSSVPKRVVVELQSKRGVTQ